MHDSAICDSITSMVIVSDRLLETYNRSKINEYITNKDAPFVVMYVNVLFDFVK